MSIQQVNTERFGLRFEWRCDKACTGHSRWPHYIKLTDAAFAEKVHNKKKHAESHPCPTMHNVPVWFVNKQVGTYFHFEDYVRATHCPTCGVRLPEVELPETMSNWQNGRDVPY
jgi:hypothetical protein